MKKTATIERLTVTAIMLAIAVVLNAFPVYTYPAGGSITIASMLPIIIIAYKYGFKWGCFSSFTFVLLMFALGDLAKAVSYSGGRTDILIGTLICDYFIAFMALSLGAVFYKKQGGLIWGTILALTLRYLAHLASGTIFFGTMMGSSFSEAFSFSIGYNAAYMIPELIITVTIGFVFSSIPVMNKLIQRDRTAENKIGYDKNIFK